MLQKELFLCVIGWLSEWATKSSILPHSVLLLAQFWEQAKVWEHMDHREGWLQSGQAQVQWVSMGSCEHWGSRW